MLNDTWTLLVNGAQHTLPATHSGTPAIPPAQLAETLGWELHDAALCRADRCISLSQHPGLLQNGTLDLRELAAVLRMPLAISEVHRVAALAESPEEQSALLRGGQAPDFTLKDLAGREYALADFRGQKVLLVTWASWCGCREDLSAWQAQYEALKHTGLTILTISQDARPEDARPFIEAANPTHPALLDPDHIVSHRYGLINVPTAIWIDENGQVARPPRVEHATNTFSFAHGLDCEPHLAALKTWAETGQTDFSPEQTRATTLPPVWDEQLARAHHTLAWHLHQLGAQQEAEANWAEAVRLAPHDWTIRRGSMWLRGANPFGTEFAEAWMEWENAGRPDYVSLAAARTEGAPQAAADAIA